MSLSELDSLVASGHRALVVHGGSGISLRRSPTSDRDFFVIADERLLPALKRSLARVPKADVEVRDVVWLEQICAELAAFSPSVSGGPTQFTFWDLRFLARTVNGEEVVGCEELSVPIRAVARPLQEALAAFFSATYVSTYEDIVGLTLAGRYDEGILIAGELAQRACILALLQTTLVDPSPKWAISLLRESGSDLLQRAAAPLFRHLSGPPSRAWAVRLLALANGVVAAGIAGARRDCTVRSAATEALTNRAPGGDEPDARCLMGIPGYLTAMDVLDNRILACNSAFVTAAANAAHAAEESAR